MFAIASDNPDTVRKVLEKGEAGPNDDTGPQSALAFALTTGQLTRRVDIVKTLLAYGAEPASLRDPLRNPPHREDAERDGMFVSPPPETSLGSMDPATRYYVLRADSAHTRRSSALVQRSFFRPLVRARYDIVGQDRVFEQLFLVLNQHSRSLSVSPVIVLLCGPSGHGKSFLARQFASLLSVPAHTVNMTTLRSTHDIWQSHSMSPYEEPSNCTLAQFLLQNEGKRCVVVLDEIEKVNDPKVLYPLLMPWELGRCSLKAGDRHVDVRNVVWIGTSNVGHDLVFQYECLAYGPDGTMSRNDYLKLTDQLRPLVSERLGASLVSRVTAILPFVPFTEDEQMAIATEALYSLGGEPVTGMSVPAVEDIARTALERYIPAEGARSIYRAVSALLLDVFDDAGAE
ncbi:P-loop containing nucleoside triphosphate hydrolase protein [Vararia minispora EC-137]|uniref:P-loop containing nucleoside triphosphate hydrolase protein n=1 Tax=Vararia minispora EC-137 TaxID=1314806 RepID=A0ACB8QQ77_9AGAM|nr:P-loop containing nucleoside triphosphate hydrolase protein [Vararia minispora EC-137]